MLNMSLNLRTPTITSSRSTICFENWKPRAGEKSVESESESVERTTTISKLTEGLGLAEAGHQGLWGTLVGKSNEQLVTGEGIMRMRACCEEILKEENKT
jgi:hypothetical protein